MTFVTLNGLLYHASFLKLSVSTVIAFLSEEGVFQRFFHRKTIVVLLCFYEYTVDHLISFTEP